MFMLINDENPVTSGWKTLKLNKGDTPHSVRLPIGPVLVPLSVWQARRAELIHREYEHGWPLGIWLAAEEGPEAIEHDIDDFTVIAVEFDKYTDGKSYSTARLLRERYGYKCELRAIGDVPRDKLAYQRHVGFDTFVVRTSKHTGVVLTGLFDFKATNQSAADPGPQRAAIAG